MEIPDKASPIDEWYREQNKGFRENPTAQQEVDFTKKSQKAFSSLNQSSDTLQDEGPWQTSSLPGITVEYDKEKKCCTRGSIFSHYWKDTDYL